MSATPLVLRLFGPLDVRVEGAPLPRLRSRKGQWLLALLALRHGSEVERAWLAGMLWPDSPEERALASLRQTLADLRRALGREAARLVSPTPRTLCLDLTGAEADVAVFDRAVTRGDIASLEEAVRLYRGPLLEGCAEEWIFQERRVREEQLLQALETLAADGRDPATAAGWLRRAVAVDPLRETARRALMRALADSGSYAGAVQTYRDLRLRLREQLGADPAPQTEALYRQIRAEARRRAEPPPEAAGMAPPRTAGPFGSLPRPLTGLIGREAEIGAVTCRLRSSRLVTLTGAGGVGKTRLAIRVAEEVAEDFGDGAWFVDLGALADPLLAGRAVAAVLGAREEPAQTPAETLIAHLRSRSLLLVLDNCEHLVAACAELAERLLLACPDLRVLATSRQALGITGETVWRVPSLVDGAAARLFAERAAAVQTGFALSDENAPVVAQICRRLDGIPLAIELAAARLQALPVEEVLLRLDDRFRLLSRGSRTAPTRHQTLRAALDWSHDLLAPPEQALLGRLSVFAGGWTLAAAEIVCSGDGIAPGDVLDLLSGLVDKSLVVYTGEQAGRYRLLETVRQYAAERLRASGEAAVRARHGGWAVSLAEEAEPMLVGPEQAAWLRRLETEHDNLRAALDGSLQNEAASEIGLRLAAALCRFWSIRGYVSEGRERLAAVLLAARACGSAPTEARARALGGAGNLAIKQGDYPAARALHEEALALCRKLGDRTGVAAALNNLGNVTKDQGDYAAARRLYEQCVEIARELNNQWGVALALNNLGNVASAQNDYPAARACHEEALALMRGIGDRSGIALALTNLGNAAGYLGDHARAHALHSEALAIHRELENRGETAISLNNLGDLAVARGDHTAAGALYRECLALTQELGDRVGTAYALEAFARLSAARGRQQDAGRSSKDAAHAAQLLGAAEALRETIGAPLPPNERGTLDRDLAAARALLGEEGFAAAIVVGRGLTPEQAIAWALSGPRYG